MRYRILDLETVPHPYAHQWAEPVTPDSRLKDPAKIAESIKEKTADRDAAFGLDADCCRIVALGFHDVGYGDPTCYLMRDELEEREHLRMFWESYRQQYTKLVTFNGARFDLPVLVMRSIYLDVPYPNGFVFYPAWKSEHIDLYEKLSINGARKAHGLKFYSKRMGFESKDPIDGSQIAQLAKEERWADIESHCLADVGTTHALANRLGLLKLGVAA